MIILKKWEDLFRKFSKFYFVKFFFLCPMIPFKTALILKTESSKEFSLPETHGITCFSKKFAINPNKNYLFSSDDGLCSYTTNPLNRIKRVEYKKEVKDICASNDTVFLLNDDSLVFYSQNKFNVISSNFKACSLKLIKPGFAGIQGKSDLTIFDTFGRRNAVYKCQTAFSDRDLLLLGDINSLKVYIKDSLAFEVAFPDFITSILADPLFTKIYCSTQDNNIYVYDLNGGPLKTLEYHERNVKQLKLSFCGKYLYSCDDVRICIWSTEFNVVLGYIDVEEGIDYFETILVDDYEYNIDDYLI